MNPEVGAGRRGRGGKLLSTESGEEFSSSGFASPPSDKEASRGPLVKSQQSDLGTKMLGLKVQIWEGHDQSEGLSP